jgi:hypothetical protein
MKNPDIQDDENRSGLFRDLLASGFIDFPDSTSIPLKGLRKKLNSGLLCEKISTTINVSLIIKLVKTNFIK